MSRGAKRIKGLATLLAITMLISLLTACGGGKTSEPETETERHPGVETELRDTSQIFEANVPEFYRNLSGLLSHEKNSHYFD